MKFRITIGADEKSVQWHGVATGPTTVMAISKPETMIVLKIGGHTSWVSGTMPNHYSPAVYQVHRYKFLKDYPDGSMDIELEELFGIMEWPVRGKKS